MIKTRAGAKKWLNKQLFKYGGWNFPPKILAKFDELSSRFGSFYYWN